MADLAEPERYAASVLVWDRFYERERKAGRMTGMLTVDQVNKGLVDRFIAFRKGEGASAPTISRDIAALRGPINWGLNNNLLTSAPRVPDVKGKKRRRELEWNVEQCARILEAAARLPERQHVFLYSMIHLSTHGRSEAILELDSRQIRYHHASERQLIHFNAPGREQTRKRRSIVPVAPTLAPWLEGIKGKVITYRVATKQSTWADPDVPEYYERETADIGRAFDACLVEAGLAYPDLDLCEPVLDADGEQVTRVNGRTGEIIPMWKGKGTPNTLRHTIHTWHQSRGVPQAQIDAAAGHTSEQGSGANYTHIRPDYMRELIESVEAFWAEMTRFTTVHLRYQRGTNVASLAERRASA